MTVFLANLQVILFLSYLTVALLAAIMAGVGRNFPGAWLWVLGLSLLALGTGLDLLPPDLPLWVPRILTNLVYTAAFLPFLHSVWVFRFETKFSPWAYLAVLGVLLALVLVYDQPYRIRTVTFSALMGAGTLVVAGCLLWRVERPFWLSNGLTAFPFLVFGLVCLVRCVHFLGFLTDAGADPAAPANVWYISGALIFAILALFGYHLMTGQRAEQLVRSKDIEIEARNRKLMESGRAKDLFFSIIAHDLRGPIGGAARYVRKHLLGKMTGLEAKYTEVETLASALDKTNEFLEKLLWWSRAQLQDWVPNRLSLDLEKTFDQSLSLVRSAADLKEITLAASPPPYPRPVADPESVQLILGNLLSNAVKFSLPGHQVRLAVSETSGLCRITVEDEGVGMDEKTIDRLFRIEDKLTTHGTTGERGSGLGLLLAQSLAERNNGGITIESEPGVGTKATLWLPTEG